MLDKYIKEYKGIHVPSHLKASTLCKMQEEKERQKRKRWKYGVALFGSACAILIILFSLPKSEIRTDLLAGTVIEDVKLNDGELHFLQSELHGYFANTPSLQMESISRSKAYNASGYDIKPLKLDGFTLKKKQYYAYYQKQELQYIEWVFFYEMGRKQITLQFQNRMDEVTTNSLIGDTKAALYYSDKTETVYDAYVQKDKGIWHIQASDMEQEEFIEQFMKILKKI